MWNVFRSRRLVTLAGLGFGSGLPLGLTLWTLGFWMADVGISLKTIAAFSLVGLAYTFKFAWAPLLDRFPLPWLGRRRGWIVLFQVLLIGSLVVMGSIDPKVDPVAMAFAAALTAFLSASQDIVVDAHRADLLSADERAAGTAAYVLGARIALFLSVSVALVLADATNWHVVYWSFAGLMAIAVVACIAAEEPKLAAQPLPSFVQAWYLPLVGLLTLKRSVVIIGFVALYKFGDGLAGIGWSKFTIDYLGFTLTEIGLLNKALTFTGTVVGTLAGVPLVKKLGLRRSLLVFGVAQAVTNLLYSTLALTGKSYVMLGTSVFVDNAANGMGSTAFLAYLLSLTNRTVSATQYALLTALSSLGQRVFGFMAGPMVEDWFGWAGFYAITGAIMVPALVLTLFVPMVQPQRS
jgi:MFS transporter, PAT family, beta-lactamase induction signal transducer AmpG